MALSDSRRNVIGWIGGIILGAVLVIATFGKVAAPVVFVEQIRNENLDFLFSANTVALIALAVEMGLGVALLLGDRSRWVLYPSALLVAFFLAITARTYWLVLTGQLDNTYDCGCFGVFLERTATEAFWQDLFLLLPPLFMCFVGRTEAEYYRPSWRFWVGVLSAVLVVLYTAFAVSMPVNDDPALPAVDQVAEEGFSLVTDYTLLIDGKEASEAEIFQGKESLQFVILVPQIASPLVLDLRQNEVFTVAPEAVTRGTEAGLDLDFSAASSQGPFELGAGGLAFTAVGHTFALQSR